MPQVDFGGADGAPNSNDLPVYTPGLPLPGGRPCSDGNNRAAIGMIYAYFGGFSGIVFSQLVFGGASSAFFNQPAGGPSPSGWKPTNLWIVAGGTATFYIYANGHINFHRGGGGYTTYDDVGDTYAGAIRGHYYYYLPALKPTIGTPTSSVDGTSATVPYTAPSDTGELSLTGYNVQRATNSAFTTGVQTISRSAAQLSATFTGLTPGVQYYYRSTAKNALTDTAGVLGGQWSDVKTLVQNDPAGLGKQYRGGTQVRNDGKTWRSGSWLDLEGRRWSGSLWTPLGH